MGPELLSPSVPKFGQYASFLGDYSLEFGDYSAKNDAYFSTTERLTSWMSLILGTLLSTLLMLNKKQYLSQKGSPPRLICSSQLLNLLRPTSMNSLLLANISVKNLPINLILMNSTWSTLRNMLSVDKTQIHDIIL